MEELGLVDAVSDLRHTHQQQQQEQAPAPCRPNPKPRAPAPVAQPTRRSLRGTNAVNEAVNNASIEREPTPALLTLEEYFKANDIDFSGAIRAEGFRGWVNPTVREEFGIASNAQEAWESQGGGKYTRKIDKKGTCMLQQSAELNHYISLTTVAQPSQHTSNPRAGATPRPWLPCSCSRTPTSTFTGTQRPVSRRHRVTGATRSTRCLWPPCASTASAISGASDCAVRV